MKTLGEIQTQLEKLAGRVQILSDPMISFGKFPGHYTYLHLENNEYHWVVGSDSTRTSDRATSDICEWNYVVFETLLRQMGLIHEVMHRNPTRDNRRLAWTIARQREKQEELKWYPHKDHQ